MKTKKKKLLSLLLSLSMIIVVMAGCGSNSSTPESETPAAESPEASAAAAAGFSTSDAQAAAWETFVSGLSNKYAGKTLNIVTVSDPWLSGMKTVTAEFEKLTGATVNFSDLGYDACYSKETLIASQKSDEADIFIYDFPWIGALAENMVSLNDYLDTNADLVDYEDFFKVGQEGSNWDGNIVGLPFAPYFTMLTYNKQMLSDAGLEPPTNFDELKEDAAQLTTDTVDGIAMNNQSGTCVGQAYFEYIYNFGGKPFESCYPGSSDYYADMTPLFNSEKSLEVVQFFKDMIPYEGKGALNMAWNERFSAFATGSAAMMSPWITDIMPLDDESQSTVAGNYGTEPPVCAEGVAQHTPVGGYSMGVNKYAAEPDLAMDFLAWFTSPETAYEFIGAGGLPARYSLINDPTLSAKYEYYTTLQKIVDTAFPAFRPQIPESFEIMDTVGTYIGHYLDGSMGLEEAMDAANSEVAELLKNAGYTVNS